MIRSDDYSTSFCATSLEAQLLAAAEQRIAALEKENTALKKQLAASANKTSLLEYLKDPVMLIGADGKGIYANSSAMHFWENKEEEWEKAAFSNIMENNKSMTVPALTTLLETASEIKVESHFHGNWFLHHLIPVKDESGAYSRLLIHSKDITEQKYIQEEAEKFILLVENSNDLIGLSDIDGGISYINKIGTEQLGLESLQHVKGLNVNDLVQPEHEVITLEELNQQLIEKGVWRGEVTFKKLDTEELVPFDATCFYIYNQLTKQPRHIATVCRNLSRYKAAQQHLQSSLQEKEALLSEVHHRVKNNLAVISALLSLQSLHMEDAQVQAFVEDIKHRIRAMALIHERLYQTDSFSKISMQGYIAELADYLYTSFRKDKQDIGIFLDIDELYFDITTSVPIGLIVSELVTNAFKYAYQEQERGILTIKLKAVQQGYRLTVADDGKGITQDPAIVSSGFGMMLVNSLAQQLEGYFELEEVTRGCQCTVYFKEIHLKKATGIKQE